MYYKNLTTTIDDAEDLDLVRPVYNLIEYNSDYSETAENLQFYSKDKATNFNVGIEKTDDFKPFKYKAKLTGNTVVEGANGKLKNSRIDMLLKDLRNLWRSLAMPLINFVVTLSVRENQKLSKHFSKGFERSV